MKPIQIGKQNYYNPSLVASILGIPRDLVIRWTSEGKTSFGFVISVITHKHGTTERKLISEETLDIIKKQLRARISPFRGKQDGLKWMRPFEIPEPGHAKHAMPTRPQRDER